MWTKFVKNISDIVVEDHVLISREWQCSFKEAPAFETVVVPFAWVLTVLTILSNSVIVVLTVFLVKKGEEPQCTYMLLGNIAISDLLTGVLQAIEMSSISTPYTDDSKIFCILKEGANSAITLVSIYSVFLISVDRFMFIVYGIRYNQITTMRKVGISIVMVWTLGIGIGLVPLIFWNNATSDDDMCRYAEIAPTWLVIFGAVMGILPVIYVMLLYKIILYKAIKNIMIIRRMTPKADKNENKEVIFNKGQKKLNKKIVGNEICLDKCSKCEIYTVQVNEESVSEFSKSDEIRESQKGRRRGNDPPSKCKAIKVVVFTTACFAWTWVPYFIFCIIFVTTNKEDDIEKWCTFLIITRMTSYVGIINSFLNPIIYAWWHNRFRKSVKKILCRRKKKLPLPKNDK